MFLGEKGGRSVVPGDGGRGVVKRDYGKGKRVAPEEGDYQSSANKLRAIVGKDH